MFVIQMKNALRGLSAPAAWQTPEKFFIWYIKATDIFGYIYKAQSVIKNIVAMSTQSKAFSFKGQKIFVGLDVHLRSWSVTVLSEQAVLK